MSSIPKQYLHLIYPETDGEPMAENTLQFEWIVLIKLGLEASFKDDANVFIAGDLFWYPIEGRPDIRLAPNVLAALGRPKGHRGAYMQWLEAHLAPQVVFEILSPGNRAAEMERKFDFYQHYGVQEYYVYDPDKNRLEGYLRRKSSLEPIPETELRDWESPQLGIRLEWGADTLRLYQPGGAPFLSYMDLLDRNEAAIAELREKRRALSRIKQQMEEAEERAFQAEERAEQEVLRANRLAEQLRRLGIELDED
jgi:Uma2 family endonuclease